MYDWLYFLHSNEEFHNLMYYLLKENRVSGITYLVFSEDIVCEDGKTFPSYEFLIAVNFYTLDTSFKDDFVMNGLTLNNLVELYEISCEDKDSYTKPLTITSKAKRIVFDRDLEKFLKKINFKFEDGSTITIPKVSLNRRL